MGSIENRLSEVSGGPLIQDDLIAYNLFERAAHKYRDVIAVAACHQPADLLSTPSVPKATHNEDYLQWSFGELWQRSEQLGKALLAKGFSADKPLAAFLRNQAEWALVLWTCIRLGVTFVPMHPKGIDSPIELKHQLGIVKPGTVIVADVETAQRLESTSPELVEDTKLKVVVNSYGSPDKGQYLDLATILQADLRNVRLPEPIRSPDDIVLFLFTGGTTSLPKPAPMKSANLVTSTSGLDSTWQVKPNRRLVGVIPIFHSYGVLVYGGFWTSGGGIVFPADVYSPAATLEAIEKAQCTDMPGNPAMIDSLVNHPSAQTRNLDSLFHINLGGSIIHPDVYKKCKAPPLSVKVTTSAFGMTEGCGVSCYAIDAKQPDYKDAVSVGKAMPGVKIRICAPDTNDPVPWGEEGELHYGQAFIYKGYPGREEDWLYSEGGLNWIRSGDQACLGDDGELYVLGRYKDLIIRGGRNISPLAIEAVINLLPGVASLVVGLPDDVAGEVPVAVVNHFGKEKYTDMEIRQTVMKALGQPYSPQRVIQLQDLGMEVFPLTPVGKADKRRLKAVVEKFCSKTDEPNGSVIPNGDTNSTSTVQTLAVIWAQLSAQTAGDISPTQPITAFADSLLVLQATSLIEKRTRKPITAEDILTHPTIEEQAKLLDRRDFKLAASNGDQAQSSRVGPPSVSEVSCVRNDSKKFDAMQQLIGKVSTKVNLSWDDVEDIVPVYDNGRFMLESACRSQSWCHRFALATDVTPDTLKKTLVESLRHHHAFRTIGVKFDAETWLHVIFRLSDKWVNEAIKIVDDTVHEADLPSYRYDDPEHDHADAASGLLFKATIVPLEKDGANGAGVIININHSMYEALSTSLWLNDWNLCLGDDGALRPSRVHYKLFADSFYFGRQGAVSRSSTEFFVRKLKGCGADKRAQWPERRAPDWMMGKPIGWRDDSGRARDQSTRPPLETDGYEIGLKGLKANLKINDDLNTNHGVSLIAIFKTAVATFNVHRTGAQYAVFSHWEAARMFPYLDDNPAYNTLLPNPMDVAGPMGQRVVDKLSISSTDNFLSLLQNVQTDITATSRQAHAPLYEIKRQLASTSPEDAEVFYDSFQRQIFNWVPQVPAITNPRGGPTLRPLQQLPHGDAGIVWTARRADKETVELRTWWDGAQLTRAEVLEAMAEVVGCAQWLIQEKGWEKDVKSWWEVYNEFAEKAKSDIVNGP